MRTIYLDCQMGAAGDMLSAALLALLDDKERESFIEEMNSIGLNDVKVQARTAVKSGISGLYYEVKVHGIEEDDLLKKDHPEQTLSSAEEGHAHPHAHQRSVNCQKDVSSPKEQSCCQSDHLPVQHEHHQSDSGHDHGSAADIKAVSSHYHHHDHAHHHDPVHHGHESSYHHPHTSLADIEMIVSGLQVSEKVQKDILNVYNLIAEAEGKAHGQPMEQIHFHEVGMLDAIADIASFCLLIEKIHPDQILVSPVCTGCGMVRCAHGLLPIPAPATAYLLEGIPMYAGSIQGELCTPTGAALLKYFANAFEPMPVMEVEKVGYGMGKRDFKALNCVRSFLGSTQDHSDQVIQLVCNIDDMTGEEIGYAMEQIMEAGARDVYTQSCLMKKSRPGIVLNVLGKPEDEDNLVRAIFMHTTTIGIRRMACERHILEREISTRNTPWGKVHVKTSSGYGIKRNKPEYEDLKRIAQDNEISILEVIENL